MHPFIQSIVLFNLISLIFSTQNSIIFPGSTRSSIPASTDVDWNVNSDIRNTVNRVINNYGNGRRTTNVNSIADKGEESRINERFTKKTLSSFDELPYDFSKTDKIHRVSDLLRFLGIENKNQTDDGLMVRWSSSCSFRNIAMWIVLY